MQNQNQKINQAKYTNTNNQKYIVYPNKNPYTQNNQKNYCNYNHQQHQQVIPNKKTDENKLNKQINENEIFTETYYYDQAGNKIIINQEKRPKVTTTPLNKSLNIQNSKLLKSRHQYHIEPKPVPNCTNQPRNKIANNKLIDEINKSTLDSKIEDKKSNEGANIFLPQEYNQQESDLFFDLKKSVTQMSVMSLASIPYNQYPTAEYSTEPFFNISGYGFNSYNGKVKKFNEDRIKVMVNYQLKKYVKHQPNISYFSIFDGHSGNKCSDFLKENLDGYLFNSSFFPQSPLKAIQDSFKQVEKNFRAMVYDPKSNILLDKSGSCALVMLIINDILYSINLGDSRALYSYDTGKYIYQITRDHKPNDEVEKKRIEEAGGKVFYANTITRNGREIELKEEQFGKGFTFPYRISPGKIAVS